WGESLSLSPQAMARLRGSSRPRRWPHVLVAAAALAVVGLAGAWCATRDVAPQPPAPVAPSAQQVDVLRGVAELEDLAVAPLRFELACVVDDGRAVAQGVWRQVPQPLRRLLGP